MKVWDKTTVGPKHEGCPAITLLRRRYDQVQSDSTEFGEAMISGEIEEKLRELLQQMDGLSGEEAQQAISAHFSDLTQQGVLVLDHLSDIQESIVNRAEELQHDCSGRLRMRAVKDGRQVLVTVCMSALLEGTTDPRDNIELVRVERKPLGETN